ncbi:MAG: hypothetical protein DRO87_06095 [Candidatus Thorarchaeota archaeon]|nr:MAG: hypothetical protein DRP09_09030 [Candidatus Thorarchaeota archaeon]RLI58150.1 MAG: hypothetical protein DRO87_06095 [Candidatus Thorarchaeota archaeon]
MSPASTDDDRKKIISVTMSESLVKRIDTLVEARVGRSRAQLIEDAVRWFLDFTVHKWTERGIYINESRTIFESETLSSLFFSKLTRSEQYELGQTAGRSSPIADVLKFFYEKNPKDPESRQIVLRLLQESGWGAISLQGEKNDLIVIGSPFYPAPYIQGYLESLLGTKINLEETSAKETVALRIKR